MAPIQVTIHLGTPLGLHARPATRIVRVAARFPCLVQIRHGDLQANAKSVLELLSLEAGPGAELHILATGAQAAEAVAALGMLLQQNLDLP